MHHHGAAEGVKVVPATVRNTNAIRVGLRGAVSGANDDLACRLGDAGFEIVADDMADVLVYLDATVPRDRSVPNVVLGAVDAPADAELPQEATPEQIEAAIRAVAVRLVVRARADDAGFGPAPANSGVLLTPRELEVLTAIGDGFSNKEIARKLAISLHTVKFHVEAIFRKLGTRSRAEAVSRGWLLVHHQIDL